MHNGEIVELVIRRHGLSITEVSRRLQVSRRSIYNWFTQQNLALNVICRIGEVLDYDFSIDMPDLFNATDSQVNVARSHFKQAIGDYQNSASYWRNKYISLLEKHNDMLNQFRTTNLQLV
ncbi:hypothetical protein Pedsa_0837 [Pseudopedobacter saltans DSM 12145]|uniref:HTH cro/C1-type domain-containing protein n=1 Tax=Pseudopedobacter saltans (strain ATCC 51119 / DSM 12145 / JCM 21818 / CCUG 39354 / LMG 10337 / NBRC 100064 / NCIMB 13643) TaxID=762903 RepID=F0S9Q3_PSESL|nr:helix-turn-helix transcriptional regulator [Pseudopedobacter saltans]ADY51409.1 hypothetical protein Pedsa_0837 [Pseudopedobacter saltans DSM 12145]